MTHQDRTGPINVDRRWAGLTAVLLAAVLGLALAVALIWQHSTGQDHQIGGLKDGNSSQSAQVQHLNELASAYATAASNGKQFAGRIHSACLSGALIGPICESAASVAAQPVPSITAKPEPPKTVIVSPSAADMARAIAAYCGPSHCSAPPTPAQVQAAFDAWCVRHGNCQGPPGRDGAAGHDGTNGSNGTNGTNGVSVSGVSQDANHHLIITLSDGTVIDVGPLPPGPKGEDATPQPFSWTYTVPGDGLTVPDHIYQTKCTWDADAGYTCHTERES